MADHGQVVAEIRQFLASMLKKGSMSQDSLPPVRPVVWTAAARADLRDIAAYIGQDSPKNAAEMVERLIGAVQILGRFPMLYQASQRFTRVRNAREIPVPPYIQ